MHLGKEVHWIWDDTTPGMGEGDLFIAVNGSGQIGHIHYVVEQARRTGARIAVVTGAPRQKTPQLADCVLFVPAYVFNGTDERCVPSIQPMGALFEQHCFSSTTSSSSCWKKKCSSTMRKWKRATGTLSKQTEGWTQTANVCESSVESW